MKKLELIFTALLVPLDYLVLLLAGSLAYSLRFESFITEIRPVIFELSYQEFLKILIWVVLLWIIVFALNGLYTTKRHKIISEVFKIFVACSAATLIIVVAFFFNFQLFSSRLIILTSWIFSIVLISCERLAIHFIKKIFYYRGIGVHKIVVIGNNKNAQDIIIEFKNNKSFGFQVVAVFNEYQPAIYPQLEKLVSRGDLDDVILADHNLSNQQKNELINFCLNHHLNYKYVASLIDTKIINFDVSTVSGVPLIEVKSTRLDGWGKILKRLFDLILALIFLLILSPVFLIVGLLVPLTSTGSIFVGLNRVGANGKMFKLYKFRSMIRNAHQLKTTLFQYNQRNDGPLFKMESDPRLTKLGKFLRHWSIDELPQLVNVILGRMSLVGPRPHEPEEVAKYQASEKKLLAIKPGMTGLAQVSGRSDLSWEEEVRLDTYYVENWSLGLDIQILLKTPKAVFSRRKAS